MFPLILKAVVSKKQTSAGVRINLTTPIKSIFVSVIVSRNGNICSFKFPLGKIVSILSIDIKSIMYEGKMY